MRTYAIIHVGSRPHVEVDTAQGKNKAQAVRNYCEAQDKKTYMYKALTSTELRKFYEW